jgi:hypothetical protein
MTTQAQQQSSARAPRIDLIVWMPPIDPSPIGDWARLVLLRSSLRGRGVDARARISRFPAEAYAKPMTLQALSRRDDVPPEHYGPLENWRGLGLMRIGAEAERDRLASEIAATMHDLAFLGALAELRARCEDEDDAFPFGIEATEAYRDYVERNETFLVDSDGRTWSDAEIRDYDRWRSEPGDRCLRLIDGLLKK